MKDTRYSLMIRTAVAVAAITFSLAVRAQAQTETILHNFDGKGDGGLPNGGLLLDSSGNLYGTTILGGNSVATNCSPSGCGVAFELSKLSTGRWAETVLRDFPSTDGSRASLISDAAGNFYGTTEFGGGSTPCVDYGYLGCGTVFRLSHTSTGWTRRVLYAFTGGADGALPYASLTFDAAGNLYGTTSLGGNSTTCSTRGCGTIFELSPNGNGTWSQSVIYTFTDTGDGLNPGPVTLDTAGNLFGTVPFNPPGQGGVFELSPTGNGPWNFQMIYTFQGSTDGSDPFSGVVIDKAGNIYASALSAGNIKDCGGSGCGSVIELSPLAGGGWSESTIFAFSGPNGENPEALVLDNAGNLYGIADAGGAYKFGVAFELSPSSSGKWTEKILHSFGSTATDGQTPDIGELTLDSTGAVYGMTTYGGKYGAGTVYKIEP